MTLELIKGFDRIGRGVNKSWIYRDSLRQELAHDYLQKINFSLQDINGLLGDSGRIERRTDVVSLIVMVDWIVDSVRLYKSCLSKGLMGAFQFSIQDDLERCHDYIKALRSIVVAHPLSTDRHKSLGFDGDIICVDLRVGQPFLFSARINDTRINDGKKDASEGNDTSEKKRQKKVRRFGVDGIESYATERSDDVYLYVYSKKANAQHFEFLVLDLADVLRVARVYIDQLCEIDKHLGKLRKKDYAAK